MEEELNKQAQYLEEIRSTLESYQGKCLHVHANLGRSKVFERDTLLLQAHRTLFIVEIEEKRGRKSRQSYQYVDILTGMVELTDPETDEMLFRHIQEELENKHF